MVFIHYIRILSSVTMPTCDVLLRHFRKMLLYTQGYAVAYSHLLSTLVIIHSFSSQCQTVIHLLPSGCPEHMHGQRQIGMSTIRH